MAISDEEIFAYVDGTLPSERRRIVDRARAEDRDTEARIQFYSFLRYQEWSWTPTVDVDSTGRNLDTFDTASDTIGAKPQSFTDLAVRGELSALESLFNACLPSILVTANIPPRLGPALTQFVVSRAAELRDEQFRDQIADWLMAFAEMMGLQEGRRITADQWGAIISDSAQREALAELSSTFGVQPPWWEDFARLTSVRSTGDTGDTSMLEEQFVHHRREIRRTRDNFETTVAKLTERYRQFWCLN